MTTFNHYEMVVLLDPKHSSKFEERTNKFKSMITDKKGTIHRFEDWGRRKPEYPVLKHNKVHYFLMNVECDIEALDTLKKSFVTNDDVLRFLVTKKRKAITEPSHMLKDIKKSQERSSRRDRNYNDNKPSSRPYVKDKEMDQSSKNKTAGE
jgi:small subunit ribosomal protein S6